MREEEKNWGVGGVGFVLFVCNISFIHCGEEEKSPGKGTAAAGAAPPTPIRVRYSPVSKLAACVFSLQGLAQVHYYYHDYSANILWGASS